jgi:DNA-binding MarR family transcriptional regulator
LTNKTRKTRKTRSSHFDLEQFLPYRLSRLSNMVSQGIARFYQEQHQLTVPEWRVMVVLGRYPGLTASEVCTRTVMDKVTVSRAVNTLLEKKYLQRVIDTTDRRKRPLRVSQPRGMKVLNEVIPYAMEYQATLQSGLTPREWSQFDSLVNKLFTAASQLNQQEVTDKK